MRSARHWRIVSPMLSRAGLAGHEPEEEGLPGDRFSLVGEFGHLAVAKWSEFAGHLRALVDLRYGIATDDGCTDGKRERVEHRLVFGECARCSGDGSGALPGLLLRFDGRRSPG